MAFPIKHDFCERSLALIRGRLWNKVARICSYWASGTGIALVKPETPTPESPIVIGLNPVEAAPAIAHEFDTQGLWAMRAQENKVDASTIKKPYDISSKDKLAEKAPKGDVAASTTETDDEKILRIGKSERLAREDHQHPSVDNGAVKLALTSGMDEGLWSSEDRLTDDVEKWSRGSTKDGSDKPCGFTVLLPCRLKDDGIDGMLRWRKFTFDECGRCMSVGEEEADYGVVVTQVER